MKILIQVHRMIGGGAERVAASWANGLAKLGDDVMILSDHSAGTYPLDPKVKLIQKDLLSPANNSFIKKLRNKTLAPLKTFRQIRSILASEKPDAIVNVLYHNHIIALLARCFSRHKCPIIMTDHNPYERPENAKMPLRKRINKFFDNRFFDKVTVLTGPDKDILNRKGIRNVEVLHNPLFLEPVKEIPEKENIVMACGRINDWHYKGFDILMKAWSEIGPRHPEWQLRVVGAGSEANKKKLKQIAGAGADSLEFVEYTTDIIGEYRKAAIFVLSSRYEGWGLVMVEALSQGCAVIASNYKGRQAEVIRDGENGLLTTPENVGELKNKLNLLIEDKKLRETLQKEAPRNLEEYSEEKTAARLKEIIRSSI